MAFNTFDANGVEFKKPADIHSCPQPQQPAMNDTHKITTSQWVWFGIELTLIGLFIIFSCLLRLIMIRLHDQLKPGAAFPTLGNIVLFGGPSNIETIFASVIIILATLIGVSLILNGPQKLLFMARVPIVALGLSLTYLTLLIGAFLLSFIDIYSRIYGPEHPPPAPSISETYLAPEYWLIGAILYAMVLIAAIFVLKRKGM